MKNTFILLFLAAITLSSCSNDGPQGPQGPQGPPGADGLIGSVIDIEGNFTAFKSGHALNNKLLHKLFEDESAYEIV